MAVTNEAGKPARESFSVFTCLLELGVAVVLILAALVLFGSLWAEPNNDFGSTPTEMGTSELRLE